MRGKQRGAAHGKFPDFFALQIAKGAAAKRSFLNGLVDALGGMAVPAGKQPGVQALCAFVQSDFARYAVARVASASLLALGKDAAVPLSHFHAGRIALSAASIRETEYVNSYSALSYACHSSAILSSSAFFVFGFASPHFRRLEVLNLALRLSQSAAKLCFLSARLRTTSLYDAQSMRSASAALRRVIWMVRAVLLLDALDLASFALEWWPASLASSCARTLTFFLGNTYHY